MALIGAVVAGVLAVVRPVTRVGAIAGWIDIVVVVVVIAVFYSIATHRGRRATAGETLLGTHYLTQSARQRKVTVPPGAVVSTRRRDPAAP